MRILRHTAIIVYSQQLIPMRAFYRDIYGTDKKFIHVPNRSRILIHLAYV